MPLESFETLVAFATARTTEHGPVLECARPGTDVDAQPLRIRAHRFYAVPCDDLFATWTTHGAWDSWMRLRARSRSTLAPYRGGAFRLELAEGPTIHVITGAVNDMRTDELLSLGWVHHNTGDRGSTVDVGFRSRQGGTDLTLVHRDIGSRREAAWLMGLWSTVLGRLGHHVVDDLRLTRSA